MINGSHPTPLPSTQIAKHPESQISKRPGPLAAVGIISEEQTELTSIVDIMSKYIYHERQESALCGQHCLNNLLQGPFFTAPDLASIAAELDMKERELGIYASANVDDSGNFSIQVLRSALQRYNGIDLPVWSKGQVPPTTQGFIVNRSEHWIAIRKIYGKWWNLNSVNEKPEFVSDFYLSALLLQLSNDGFSVFTVDGKLPDHGDYSSSLELHSSSGTWHLESELLGGASKSGDSKAGFQAFTGKGHRLGGTAAGSTDIMDSLRGDYDEEAELAKAIQASLETATSNPKEDLRAKRLAALSKQGIN